MKPHILIVPSEVLGPLGSINGIFQWHQASALHIDGFKIGLVSVQVDDINTGNSKGTQFLEGVKGTVRVKSTIERDLPVVRAQTTMPWRRTERLEIFYWIKAFTAAYRAYCTQYGEPDLLHAHNALYAGIACENLGKDYVLTEHSSFIGRRSFYAPLKHDVFTAYERAKRLITVSPYLGMQIKKLFGGNVRAFDYVPNILDPFVELSPEPPAATSSTNTILAIGSLIPIKNHSSLIQAFSTLAAERPDWSLQIGGEGLLRDELERQVKELGLENQIQLLGHCSRERVVELIDESRFLVISSHFETFGVVAIESLSRGKPVLSTRCGGPSSILASVNGHFCGDTSEELAAGLRQMIDKLDAYDPVAIRQDALDRFGSEPVLKQLAQIYSEVLAGHSRQVPFQRCSVSVMDTLQDPDVNFDEVGRSSYFHIYQSQITELGTDSDKQDFLAQKLAQIRQAGKNSAYDCILGVSGGVDSTYLASWAHEQGLRVLAVHFDNGWNSELAVANVENVVTRLGFDLETLVVDWEEFRDLQLAYLKASVIDIEAITDHAILGLVHRCAAKRKIKYILSGSNLQTETTLPRSWIHSKRDHVNIKAIHKKFGTLPLKTFPFFGPLEKRYYVDFLGIQSFAPLNYLPYNKATVKQHIQEKLGWKDYGGKHYESIWTRFFQGHILARKFGIDKRKAHLSDLVFGGQITREQALTELETPAYDSAQFDIDFPYVLKKLQMTREQFEELMDRPAQSHLAFDYEQPIEERHPWLRRWKQLYRITLGKSRARP